MSSLRSLLTIVTAILTVQLVSAYYPCSQDSHCEARLSVLRCLNGKCACKEGYSQSETSTPEFYEIQCSTTNVVVIVVSVLVVVGLAVTAGVGVYYMKRKRMGCFA